METAGSELLKAATDVLHRSQSEAFPHEIQQLGMPFLVFRNVFSPKYLPAAEMFARALPFRRGMHFLEIGPGVGVVAVAAALAGAERVVAIDLNPDAVNNTHANFVKHGVEARADARLGDLFGALRSGEKFDLIFWNVPFFHDTPPQLGLLERSIVDPHYENTKRYMLEGQAHLRPGGRLTVGFSSTVGDLRLIESIADAAGLKADLLHREEVAQYSPVEAPPEASKPFMLEILDISRRRS
jgi:methylase of polypeptide subunit release factors